MASFDFRYPEGSPGATSTAGVYLHNLSEESEKKLNEIMSWAVTNKIDLVKLNKHALKPELSVLRFLRANKFDIKKTKKAITGHLEWQIEIKLDELLKKTPEQILTCEMSAFTDLYPHWHYGSDKTGRPVMYKQYDRFLAGAIKRLTGDTFENVMNYHIWEQEAASEICRTQSIKNGTIIETVTGVIDLNHMKMTQITRNFLALVKIMAKVDQERYPETLGKIFIINAPSAFGSVWSMVKGWVDPVTRDRIQVLKGPEEYQPVLFDFIGEENLPANYGGKLPALGAHVHPYSEYLTGVAPCVSVEGAVHAVESSGSKNNSGTGSDHKQEEHSLSDDSRPVTPLPAGSASPPSATGSTIGDADAMNDDDDVPVVTEKEVDDVVDVVAKLDMSPVADTVDVHETVETTETA